MRAISRPAGGKNGWEDWFASGAGDPMARAVPGIAPLFGILYIRNALRWPDRAIVLGSLIT